MDDFGVFFSDSMGVPGQSEGDASMLKRRFREFFREFRGADSSYIYRRQLELAISTKSMILHDNFRHLNFYSVLTSIRKF